MANHYFVSYSRFDGQEFAFRLGDNLKAGTPSIQVWLDKRELKPGDEEWDDQVVEAIRTCESLIFVMTRDSVKSQSVCKKEWNEALRCKKPIILIRLHSDAVIPFLLGNRQYVDFTGDLDTGLEELRKHLTWMASPEGMLWMLKHRLGDAEYDLSRATIEQQGRIKDDISELKTQIAEQQRIVDNPEEAKKRIEKSIQSGIEKERISGRTVITAPCVKFINPPPSVPSYFQNRSFETKLIGNFLKNDSLCLMTIAGRAGIGKTVMVCRLLRSLEKGKLPDDGGELTVDGIVYLSEKGLRQVTVPNIYTDLCRLLPSDITQRLDRVYKDPTISTGLKMQALLSEFSQGRVILLLDNLETMIDPETRNITNAEVNEALHAFLEHPSHAVKVILTTRIAPYDLALFHPELQTANHLDKGLESPYAENILREMDMDEKLGLKHASESLLNEARIRTLGNPRALEALFAILCADRETNLAEIMKNTEKLLPEHVVEVLVGEAFSRLDANAQRVMQALAIYSLPVTSSAVDYMLQPYMQGRDSASVLKRLVNMHLVRKDEKHYYMHPVDRDYALSRVPAGTAADRVETGTTPFSRFALRHRGADYFKLIRSSNENWKTIDDLAPQLSEFEMRFSGEDYDTAASMLLEIDFNYLLLWGHFRLMMELHKRLAGKIGDSGLRAISAGNLGMAYHSLGQVEKAIQYYEQALDIEREIGERINEGAWLGNLGSAYSDLGQVEKAIQYYEQALTIAREIGDRRREGNSLGNLGSAYCDLGQVEKAIKYHEQALDIAREIGDRRNEGTWLGNLGIVYKDLGQVEKAIQYYEQVLDIAREIGDRRNEGNILGNLGMAYSDLGQVEKAIQYYEQALEIAKEIGDRRNEGTWLGSLGIVYKDLGQVEKAIQYYEKALTIVREIGDRRNEGNNLGNMGIAYSNLGQVEKAIQYYEKALDIDKEIGDRRNEGNNLGNLGIAYKNLGQVEKAIQYYEQALDIDKEIGDRRNEGNNLGNLGNAYSDVGQVEKAIKYHEQALTIAREIGDRRGEGVRLGNLGMAYSDLGQVEKAIQYYEQALEIAKEIGNRRNEGNNLGNLGLAFSDLGQAEKAIQYYEQALEIAKEIGDIRGEGVWLNNLGFIFQNEKKHREALACFLLAKEIRIKIKDPNIKTTESNLDNLKEALGENEFEKLVKEVEPKAEEIVRKILE